MIEIYVIVGMRGEYSDTEVANFGAFTDKSKASETVRNLNELKELYKQFDLRIRDWEKEYSKSNPPPSEPPRPEVPEGWYDLQNKLSVLKTGTDEDRKAFTKLQKLHEKNLQTYYEERQAVNVKYGEWQKKQWAAQAQWISENLPIPDHLKVANSLMVYGFSPYTDQDEWEFSVEPLKLL